MGENIQSTITERARDLPNELLLDLYAKMLKIRFFNERQAEETRLGNLFGFIHLYTGEEAVAVGAISALQEGDKITSTHRAEGHFIAADVPLDKLMAEVFGRRTGLNGGKGGPMGLAAFEHGMISAYEIVGAGVPVATGAAWAYQKMGTQQVVIAFFGDGAANQGVLYECLNMAALWKLPVVYICENNGFAVDTAIEKAFAQPEIARKAPPFGVPGVAVDGTDVVAVYLQTLEAVERARSGEGPTLIEAKAKRWVGHHQADAQWYYRSREDVEENKTHCPILAMQKYLLDNKVLDLSRDREIKKQLLAEIDQATKFAIASEWPNQTDLNANLFAEEVGK